MLDFIFAGVLLLLILLAIVLRKTYHQTPNKELKYRAVHGDVLAAKLYRAAAYGTSLNALLWLFIVFGGAGSLVLLNKIAPFWLSFVAVALLIWLAFAWLPSSKVSKFSLKLATILAPAVAYLLNYLHPLFERLRRWLRASFKSPAHTKIYDKPGIGELIEQQKTQSDNRISNIELEIISRSMKLSDTTVGSVSLPWSKVKTVKADNSLGPILLNELHKTEQLLIPVTAVDEPEQLVGFLNLIKLDIASDGLVQDSMDGPIYYINEADTLDSALKSFGVTNSPMFIVIDHKQKIVGLLRFNDIVEQLVGHIPGADFDQYASVSLVARKYKTPDNEPLDNSVVDEVENS